MNLERLHTREEISSQIQTKDIIITPDNNLVEFDNLNLSERQKTLAKYNLVFEEKKSEGEKKLSTELTKKMVEMEWLDFERSSGKGHFRFYPKGAIVHSILENMLNSFAQNDLDVIPVISPIVLGWEDDQIKKEAGSFNKNIYHIRPESDSKAPEQILRYACNPGIFKIMQDANLTETQLPVRVYEAGTLFRSNKPGERLNIQRADSFFLHSIFSFCKNDISIGLEEFIYMHNSFSQFLSKLELEYSHKFEINDLFFNKYRDQIVSILKFDNKPALISLSSGKRNYYEIKSDHVIDNEFESFNLQLDNENATTYDVGYNLEVGDQQEKKPCTIIHSSLSSIERWMLILLNKSLKKSPQELPLWLAPIQIRIIPLDKKYTDFLMDVAKGLNAQGIRADIDDQNGKINSKIKRANNDLIPYTFLWGLNENNDQIIRLRARNGTLTLCDLKDLPNFIKSKIEPCGLNLNYHPHLPIIVSKSLSF